MATIDVTEIINATPAPSSKRPRLSEDVPSNNSAPSDPSSLLAALESGGDAVELDETQLKRLVAQLEKKSLKNREMRIKHADDPQKFMESEVDLNVAIQELTSIAAQPELFSLFISLRGPQMLVTLLAHENTDIVAAVLNLVKELLEDDGESGENEEVGELANAFSESNCVDCMVSALSRVNESINDYAEAERNAVTVNEALTNLTEALHKHVARKQRNVENLTRLVMSPRLSLHQLKGLFPHELFETVCRGFYGRAYYKTAFDSSPSGYYRGMDCQGVQLVQNRDKEDYTLTDGRSIFVCID